MVSFLNRCENFVTNALKEKNNGEIRGRRRKISLTSDKRIVILSKRGTLLSHLRRLQEKLKIQCHNELCEDDYSSQSLSASNKQLKKDEKFCFGSQRLMGSRGRKKSGEISFGATKPKSIYLETTQKEMFVGQNVKNTTVGTQKRSSSRR